MTIPSLRPRLSWIAVVLLTGLLATACKAEISIGGLNVAELESAIDEELFGEGTDQSIDHSPVECPDDPDEDAGSTFICSTTVMGETITVRVTMTDNGADFVREQAILDLDKARDFLAQFLIDATGVAPADISCPDQVVYSPGESFVCRATDAGGGTVDLEVVVRDVEGNVDVNPR